MEGETMYNAHREYMQDLDLELPPWFELDMPTQDKWDEEAYHQTLRDRGTSATIVRATASPRTARNDALIIDKQRDNERLYG